MDDPLAYPPPWLRRLRQGAKIDSISSTSPSRGPGGGGSGGPGGEGQGKRDAPKKTEQRATPSPVQEQCPNCHGPLPPPTRQPRSGFERFCPACRPIVFPGPDPLNADCTYPEDQR
jgi:hypothetical protein